MLPLLCMLIAPALAQDPQERAKLHYSNGAALYEEGRYEQAILAFREAHELSGNEKLLYNVANAQERLGDLQGALDTLHAYRIHAATEERQTLDRRILSVQQRLEEAKAAAVPPPAPVPVIETRPNGAKWVLFGVGAAVATGAGATAALTYASGRGHAERGEQRAYASARAVNNVAVPVAGLGVGVAVVGIVLPGGATLRLRF